jgi:hypothetical protein
MSYASAALEHAAFQMSEYHGSLRTKAKTETSDPKTSSTWQKPASPRASLASRFSFKVPLLAQRVCVWIKDKVVSVKAAILRFIRAPRSHEKLLSFGRILGSDDVYFNKDLIANLEI